MSTGSLCVECLTAGSGYGGRQYLWEQWCFGCAVENADYHAGVYAGIVEPVASAVAAAVFGTDFAGVSGIAGEAGGLRAGWLENLPEKQKQWYCYAASNFYQPP